MAFNGSQQSRNGQGSKVILTLETLQHYVDDIDDCWIWKNGVGNHGYPQAHINGSGGVLVRTYIFRHLMNRDKPRGYVISNTCMNKKCLNPEHIKLTTPGKVQERAYSIGRRNPTLEVENRRKARRATGQKMLTEEQVMFIRMQPFDRSHNSIAKEMGIHHKSVSRVRNNETHRTLAPNASVFAWRP